MQSQTSPNKGTKSKVVASPLPSRGPERGRYCYITPAFSGVPNAKRGEQNQKWLPCPCLLGAPQMGGNATSPLHSRGSPTPTRGTKSDVVASPPPSPGPTNARNCCVTHAISNVPKQGNKIKSGYLTPTFSGAERGRYCYVTPAFSGVPNANKIRTACFTLAFSEAHK